MTSPDSLLDCQQRGRGPPQNVTVRPGVTSLTVSWDPPDEPPLYYTVTVGSDTQVIYGTSVIINNLQPCTAYIISVVSVYQDEESLPTYSSGKTLDSVPPPPQSCWFDDITSTAMMLYWQDADINCAITNHNISWSWDVLWSDEAGSGVDTNTGYHMRLRDLSPYTNVTAEVASYTDAGYGPSTSCWNVTSQEIPGPVVITNITWSDQSLYVTWSPPEEENGVILEYSINIMNEDDTELVTVDGTTNEAAITDLQQCVSYDVTVEAATEAGWGPPSDVYNIFTNGPPSPPDKCWFSDITYNKMVINWVAPDSQCGVVNIYRINWWWDVLWSDEQGSNETLSKETSITLTNLPSYTNVTADVAAATDTGFGPTTTCWNVTSPDKMYKNKNIQDV
ncbi:phosphatidylinositol phosphatase PTPRQ-like [Cherax quadricarinatus]